MNSDKKNIEHTNNFLLHILIYHVWLTFALFSSLITIFSVVLGSQWDRDETYLYSGLIAVLMLPSIIIKDLVKTMQNQKISNYSFFATVILITVVLICVDHTYIRSESFGLLSGLGIAQGFCGFINYFFIKYLAEKNAISLVVRILGFSYLVFYLIVIVK